MWTLANIFHGGLRVSGCYSWTEAQQQMARLIGDNRLPSSVQRKRRRMREKVNDLREPIREKRESYVPGPDVIGSVESRASSLRDKFVTSDSLVSRIRDRSPIGGDGDSGDDGDNGSEEESQESSSSEPENKLV